MAAVHGLVQKAVERDVKRFQHMNTSPGTGAVRSRYKGQGGGEGWGTVDVDQALLPFLHHRGEVGVGVVGVYPHVSIAEALCLLGEIKRVRGDRVGARDLLTPGGYQPHALLFYHEHTPSCSNANTPSCSNANTPSGCNANTLPLDRLLPTHPLVLMITHPLVLMITHPLVVMLTHPRDLLSPLILNLPIYHSPPLSPCTLLPISIFHHRLPPLSISHTHTLPLAPPLALAILQELRGQLTHAKTIATTAAMRESQARLEATNGYIASTTPLAQQKKPRLRTLEEEVGSPIIIPPCIYH